MRQLRIFSILTFIGVGITSCNTSEKEPYRPDPNKGDYMKVVRMEVVKDVEKEHLLEKLYTIDYTATLKAKLIKEYKDVDVTALPGKAPLSYVFDYLKDESLNSIIIKKDEEVDQDKLIADYRGGVLRSIKGDDASKEITFDFVNTSNVKVSQLGKTYNYEFDNRGNLISVSDASGKLFSYSYSAKYNPFVHSEYNLIFDYVPGGELIRFVMSSKNEMSSALNEKTGEKYTFEYKYEDFGYPISMLIKGGSNQKLFKFSYKIFRRPDL